MNLSDFLAQYTFWIALLIIIVFVFWIVYTAYQARNKPEESKEKKSPFAALGEFASNMQKSQSNADPDEFMPKGLVEKDDGKDVFSTDFSKFKNKGL